ncbi:MAG TPA: hypothetical protein VFQ38_17585 [Longimicrobiales bacterium]|nr:hypothetical protein [Longimicrobiales bacterium]
MRIFRSADGHTWAVLEVDARPEGRAAEFGWLGVLFRSTAPGGAERLVQRPAGWLERASHEELAAAFDEGDGVRARWGVKST